MKKILPIIATLLIMNGIESSAQKLFIGLEGGLINPICTKNDQNRNANITYRNYTYNRYSRTTSFNIGINIEYALSQKWSISSKLLFSKEGFKERYSYTTTQTAMYPTQNFEFETISKYNSVRIPILAQYNILQEGKCFGLSLIAGPSIAYNVGWSTNIIGKNELSQDLLNSADYALAKPVKYFDFALQLGVIAHKHISKNSKIFFEVQGMQSLNDITNLDLNLRQDNIINRRIASNFGFQIGL